MGYGVFDRLLVLVLMVLVFGREGGVISALAGGKQPSMTGP